MSDTADIQFHDALSAAESAYMATAKARDDAAARMAAAETENEGLHRTNQQLATALAAVEGAIMPPGTEYEPLENRTMLAAQPVVTRLDLIRTDTQQVVMPLSSQNVIDTRLTGTEYNVKATLSNGESAHFALSKDGASVLSRVESYEPLAMAGDTGGAYKAWTPGLAVYTLSVTPYQRDGASGKVGNTLTVGLSFVQTEVPVPPEPPPPPPPPPGPTGTIIKAGSQIPASVSGAILLERGAIYTTTGITLEVGASIDAVGDASLPLPVIKGTATGTAPELIKCQGQNKVRNAKLDSVTNDTYGIVVYGVGVTVQGITSTSRFSRVVYNKTGSDVLFADSTFVQVHKFLLYVGGASTGTTMRNVNLTGGNWWEAIFRSYGDNVLIEDCTWARPRFADSAGTLIPLKGIAIRGGKNITLRRVTMTGNGGQVAIGGLDSESHAVENVTLEDCDFDVPQIYIRYGVYNTLVKGGKWKASGAVIDIESVSTQPGRTAPTGKIERLAATGSSFIGGSAHELAYKGIGNTLNGNPV